MPRSRRWVVSGLCLISVSTEVDASTAEEALAIAKRRQVTDVEDAYSASDMWVSDGTLDGEPYQLSAEEADRDKGQEGSDE